MRPFAELLHALHFLTRLPLPFTRTIDLPPLSQSMRLFPVAGALIGALTGLALWLSSLLNVGPFTAAIIAIVAGLFITGALHEDGLADTVDGFWGGRTRERRLEIMRDSRIGTYGTLALISAIGLRVSLYSDFAKLPMWEIIGITAAAGAFSRALMVDLMWATRPARSDGLSVFAGTPGRNGAAFAILTATCLTLFIGFYWSVPHGGLFALGAGLAVTGVMRRLCISKIGGQTGDVCGATQVLSEIAMLLVFAATLR
jgi:adenosylcobinamide-GDP ribazoletransferase